MKTSYLVRKNTWMDDAERKVARRIAREAEKSLEITVWKGDSVAAVVFYCAGCAVALLGRVQARYAAALMAGEDLDVLEQARVNAEHGMMRAVKAVDALVEARLWRRQGAWEGYANAGVVLKEAGDVMQDLALNEEAALAARHATKAEVAEREEAPVEAQALEAPNSFTPEGTLRPELMEELKTRIAAYAAQHMAPVQEAPPAQEAPTTEFVPRWLRRQREQEAAREARRQARQAARAAAR